ncbi:MULTISPECIES: GGDEF domain-containing protein [unclassified Alteromonas]|uniref:GGDEF domain-containing protein n=1 Tax=unclassified Alteromonas TaxID=2614992 RepID=UPI001364409E|nr:MULTISPECIES: GGDEF domain-containing protein [unclassified Alteromonas]
MKNQVNAYANLAHAVLYEWNYPSKHSNEEILLKLHQSDIQSDESDISVVFRHTMALSNVQHKNTPRLPIVIKRALLEKHWQTLKEFNIRVYAALRGYYIYIKGINDYQGSLKRLSATIPALDDLKQELLLSGDTKAIAIATLWLAIEYSDSSPIRAIQEYENALPYLPIDKFDNKLEMEFDQQGVHYLLADSYLDLNIPSKAAYHTRMQISLKKKLGTLDTSDFTLAVSALNRLSKFTEALELLKEANSIEPSQKNFKSVYIDMLRMSIYASRLAEGDRERLLEISSRIINSSADIPSFSLDVIPTATAIYTAIKGSDEEFMAAILAYEDAINEKLMTVPYKKKALLGKFLALKHIYEVRGDAENAFLYQEKYREMIVNYHDEKFQLSASNKLNMLSRDIELAKYRQKELATLQKENTGLAGDKEKLRTTVFALITIICSILTTWLWIAKRKSDTKADTDSLTGALTRRAMLKQLKSLLKKHPASCLALIDIDHFKRINDKYGHAVGDEVLNTFSQTIRKRIRKSDLLCRYGGEEFLIYFENSSEQEVKSVLDELNYAFSRVAHWEHTDKAFTVSFSSGVVALNGSISSESVIKICDELLYKAKNSGRSRVESTTLAHA